jgi:hypothetical protein
MKNRSTIDLFCIIGLGAVFWAMIYLATTYDLLETWVTPENGKTFGQEFSDWAMIVMGISFLAVLVWYVLGEWGPRAHTMSSGAWMALWVCLLALVLAAAFAAILLGPQATENSYVLALFFIGGGVLFYWIATVCFSPVGVKTIPPLATLVRRW